MKRLLLLFLLVAGISFGQITSLPPGGGGGVSSADADAAIQDASPLSCVDAGANDSYTCTMSPVPATAAAAPVLWFNPNTANTGAATLDIGPGSALAIYKHSDGTALADNDLRADVPVLLTYCAACNSAAGAWIISGLGNTPAGADDQTAAEVPFTPAGTIAATDVQAAIEETAAEAVAAQSTAIKCVDAGANDTYTCTMSPVPATAADAPLVWLDPNTLNTGAATLDIGPGSALAIYQNGDGNDPDDSDFLADRPVLLRYCASCNSAAGAWLYTGKRGVPDNAVYSASAAADAVAVYDSSGLLPIAGMPTELFRNQFCAASLDPQVGDVLPPVFLDTAFTIDKVVSGTTTGTVTLNVEKRTTIAGAGTDVMSADLVTDATDQSSCASGCTVNTISAGSVDADTWLVWTISAVSTPGSFSACVLGAYQ